jgi:hypothetical protein
MIENPQGAPLRPPSEELEGWIDESVVSGVDEFGVAAHIAEITRPGGEGVSEGPGVGEISPDLAAAEGWLWPWNRAGFLYIEKNRADAAVTIFQCAYLAAIHFQHVRQYRMHKGMPLCNVAYAYLSAKKPERAWVPAMLGMAEDAMTAGNPTQTASFQNLIAADYLELPGRVLGEFFITLTRRQGLFPLYPECVLDCAIRESPIIALDWVKSMQTIAAEFTPATIKPALERLTKAWDRLYLPINRKQGEHGRFPNTVSNAGFVASSSTGAR